MHDETSLSDLRCYPRFTVLECAMVHPDDGQEPFRAMVVDISIGGAQLRSKEHIDVGATCGLELGTDLGAPLRVSGEVRFSVPIPHSNLNAIGFKFLPKDHAERAAVAAFVHRVFLHASEE